MVPPIRLITMILVAASAVSATDIDPTKTVMAVFCTSWSRVVCESPTEAADSIRAYLQEDEQSALRQTFDAVNIQCDDPFQKPFCVQLEVRTYPTILVFPSRSEKYWKYEGAQNEDEMWHGLVATWEEIPLTTAQSIPPVLGTASYWWFFAAGLVDKACSFVYSSLIGNIVLGITVGMAFAVSMVMVSRSNTIIKFAQIVFSGYLCWVLLRHY